MSMIQDEELVRIFSERTLINLEYIEQKCHAGEQVYDATQLINSLLGLIVFPKERDFMRIPEIPLDDLEGWPHVEKTGTCSNLRDFCRRMRNAVAHCNILLLGSELIEGVKFQNKNKNGNVTWEHDFNIDEVKKIACMLHKTLNAKSFSQRNIINPSP